MNEYSIFDAPLQTPDEDLLGMKNYALTLADQIQTITPPITIGIYGEWGSGKTSFVRLVEYYLAQGAKIEGKQKSKFIRFTAWPHKTSDEIWRSLILTIARELYGVPDEPPAQSSDSRRVPEEGIAGRLTAFLLSDVPVNRPSSPVDPLYDYHALVEKLNDSPYSISNDARQRLYMDQQEVFLAIVKSAVAALGSMSPLIAGLRGLFGASASVDLGAIIGSKQNEALRNKIQSIQEFRQIIRTLFETRAKAKDLRVCVFVDDLDRCMPDVALDILEAIKVLLDEIECVFIVAADEHLIGQGLWLRYRQAYDSDTSSDSRFFIVQKGREYLEKTIQLGIRVPHPSPEQLQRFVAVQFPFWVAATDVIQLACGDNPRRLKQYCYWLLYKNQVLSRISPSTPRS